MKQAMRRVLGLCFISAEEVRILPDAWKIRVTRSGFSMAEK